MSNVRGRIAVDVQFSDSTTGTGVQSVKSLTLQHATEYDFGKVAIVSGTCGTATTILPLASTNYRNAAGDLVSFANVSRVAFSAGAAGLVKLAGTGDWYLYSRAGQVAVSDSFESNAFSLSTTAATSSYTLVLYGS